MAGGRAGVNGEAGADRVPPHGGVHRSAARRTSRLGSIVRAVLLIALVAGLFGLLPQLGGLTREAAVLAVPGYRIVNYWLPLLPGAVAYFRLRRRPASTDDGAG